MIYVVWSWYGMKVEVKRTVTETFERVISRTFLCDKCGKEIKRDGYSADNFKVILDRGSSYPEGTDIEREQAYFCDDCSYEIKDILEKNGVKFEKVDISY